MSQEKLSNEATNEVDLNVFVQKAYELGAVEAKLIKAKSVVTAPWVRAKCRYGRPVYGSRLTWPPPFAVTGPNPGDHRKLPERPSRRRGDVESHPSGGSLRTRDVPLPDI